VDIFVERRLILEIKTVEAINEVILAQVLTYLKLADIRLGLILNFHVLHLRNGIRRVVNHYEDSAPSAESSAPSAVDIFSKG
jgi:GxxExxY protein